jgi:Domain of unknown function (DUF4279)
MIGDDLVPSEVTELLGCEPTRGWAKGDTVTFHGVTRTASFGMWSLHADETSPADVDAQVNALLGRLDPDLAVWAELRGKYDINLFCGWFMQRGNEGLSLAPESMTTLGARGIRLELDLDGGSGDDEDSPD